MSQSIPPSNSSSSMQKGSPSSFLIPTSLAPEQPKPVWREQLERIARPRVLISAFLVTSAFYCFVIGRDRYTAVSEFVIQQALPLDGKSTSVLAGAAAAPQV